MDADQGFSRIPSSGMRLGLHSMGPRPSTYDKDFDQKPSFTRLARGLDRKVTRLLHEFAAVDASASIKSLLDDMGDDAVPYLVNCSDYGLTPLHTAARRGSVASARYLVAAGAELETVTMDGQTVVELATFGRNRDFLDAIPELAEIQKERAAAIQAQWGGA